MRSESLSGRACPLGTATLPTIMARLALIIFVTGELLFRRSSLNQSFSLLGALPLLDLFCLVSAALAIASVAVSGRGSRLGCPLVAVTTFVLLLSSFLSGNYRLVAGFVVLLAAAGVELAILARDYFVCSAAILVVLMLASLVGLVQNIDVIPNSRLVFSYGIGHPNTLAALLLNVTTALAYLLWEKRNWPIIVLLAAMGSVFAYITLSSNASAVLFACLAVVCVVGHTLTRKNGSVRMAWVPMRAILVILPTALMALMLVGAAFYDPEIPAMKLFARLIHYRTTYAHQYYVESGGFTLLGRVYENVASYKNGNPFSGVDSGYCLLALVHGLATAFVLWVGYLAAVTRLRFDSMGTFVFFLIVGACFFMVVEAFPMYLESGFVLLLVSRPLRSLMRVDHKPIMGAAND